MAEISGQRYAQHNFVSIASVPYPGSSNSRECTINVCLLIFNLPHIQEKSEKVKSH